MGKNGITRLVCEWNEKHPHGRGEEFYNSGHSEWVIETPPRAWGRIIWNSVINGETGNTPTGVGKNGVPIRKMAKGRKHPHGRGEEFVNMIVVE